MDNVYKKFFDAIAGNKKPVGKSMKQIVDFENLMKEEVPIKKMKN